jgi:hypothetical protein
MTVYEFCELLTDSAKIEVFSFKKRNTVFFGWSDEIPEKIGSEEVTSIDSVFPESQHLTINIE